MVNEIVNYFRGCQYDSLEAVLTDADRISRLIQQNPLNHVPRKKPELPKLSDFKKRVLEMAPKYFVERPGNEATTSKESHKVGYYNLKAMAREMLLKEGERLTVTTREVEARAHKVRRAVRFLRRRGKLHDSCNYVTPSQPQLRSVTDEDIEKNIGLVHWFVRYGSPFLSRRKIATLDRGDVLAAGRMGLRQALGSWDPKKGKLSTYAVYTMSTHVRRLIGREKRRHMESMDQPRLNRDGKAGRTRHETISTTPIQDDLIARAIETLVKRKAPVHRIGVFALRAYLGHNTVEIAREIGVKKQAVHQQYQRAFNEVARALKESKRGSNEL